MAADPQRLVCRADELCTGDRVRTPARRWETVTDLRGGDAYSRCTWVVTADTGPDFPWVWTNQHPVQVLRHPAATPVNRDRSWKGLAA
jgi:hypothetical protein